MMPETGSCFFCGRPGTYCGICKVYLCNEHRKDYLGRIRYAAAHGERTTRNVLDFLLGR